MLNCPCASVTDSYLVPVAVWTAVIVTPGSTPPCASLTVPPRLPVVTVCAKAAALKITKARAASAARSAGTDARQSPDSRRPRDGTTREVTKFCRQGQEGKRTGIAVNRCEAHCRGRLSHDSRSV